MDKFKSVAFRAAREGGKTLLKYFKGEFNVERKGRIDLVTTADIEAEKKIVSVIKKTFPSHNFLVEENLSFQQQSDFTWIIDPLDGTTNFAHRYPFFCISIALQRKEEVLLGLVFNPVAREFFYAEKGKGAFLNGKKIHVSNKSKLIDCLVATGFPYQSRTTMMKNIENLRNAWGKVQGLRRDGAAALDLCFVACSRIDGFWEYTLKPWDVAAGSLIVKEAGGKVTDFRGKKFLVWNSDVVASNKKIHSRLLKMLKP